MSAIASVAVVAFFSSSSARMDSGAVAPPPESAMLTSRGGVSERLALYAGRPALSIPALDLLFANDGASFPEVGRPRPSG